MAHYLLGVDLTDRNCVVVGGGEVAERKAKTLCEFGAAVTVVAPELTTRLNDLAIEGGIRYAERAYEPGVLDDAFLVIAATGAPEVNAAISSEARRRGVLVNVVDAPDLCTFFVPATVRRGDLVIGVSTSGKSPAMARRIREQLECRFGPEYGDMAELLGELRAEIKSRCPDLNARNRVYARIMDSGVLDLLAEGREDEAYKKAQECISQQ